MIVDYHTFKQPQPIDDHVFPLNHPHLQRKIHQTCQIASSVLSIQDYEHFLSIQPLASHTTLCVDGQFIGRSHLSICAIRDGVSIQ